MIEQSNIKKIIFCDSLTGCQNYFNQQGVEAGQDDLFIALTPAVYAFLKKRKMSVENTLPYFSNASHKRLLTKSNEVVNWLREYIDFADIGLGIENAYKDIFIFWFRFVIHYCLWINEVILNAIEKHNPDALVAVVSMDHQKTSLYIESDEGILGEVVAMGGKQRSLNVETYCAKKGISLKDKIVNVRNMSNYIFKLVRAKIGKPKNRLNKTIVFTTTSYRMDELAKQISGDEYCLLNNYFEPSIKIPTVLFGRYRDIVVQQNHLMEQLCARILSEKEIFSYRGINYASVVTRKISRDYTNFIFKIMFSSLLLDQELTNLNPAIVISNVSRVDDLVIAALCKKKQIPSLLISHGSHVKPKDEYECIEWGEHGKQFLSAPFSMIAVPTPTSNDYFDAFPTKSFIVKSKPITWGIQVDKNAGRALFYKLFGENYKKDKTNVIVHAGTPKSSNSLRFHVYETMDEYIQALVGLAKVVEQLDNMVLVIKFRPSKELDITTIKSLVPFSDKIKLSVDESLLDVLAMADLLVSFSSTAIDEALQNRIPVLLYGGNGRYQHISTDELKENEEIKDQAIYHISRSGILLEGIKDILNLYEKGNKRHLFDKYVYSEGVINSFIDLINKGVNTNE